MSKPVVPNIPPLSDIQDEATRRVVQALVEGWRVRNGEVGEGDNRFLTAADLGVTLKRGANGTTIVVRGGGAGGGGAGANPGIIGTIIDDLTGQIAQSRLWKLLEERLKWIDTPEWFRGKFGAAIKTEQNIRESQTSALSQQLTTATTNINNNIALVQENLTATSDLAGATASSVTSLQVQVGDVQTMAEQAFSLSQTVDGDIRGAWTVKFDANGYVAGAGLSIDGKDGAIQSAFGIRADRFYIGNPAVPVPDGQDPPASLIPFLVVTTPQPLPGGGTLAPGVYMKSAFIQDASITNAKIVDLSVDTLKIAGNAITVTSVANVSGTVAMTGNGATNSSSFVTVASVPITISGLPAGATAYLHAVGVANFISTAGAGDTSAYTRLYVQQVGAVVGGAGASLANGFSGTCVSAGGVAVPNGSYTVELQAAAHASYLVSNPSLSVIGAKR